MATSRKAAPTKTQRANQRPAARLAASDIGVRIVMRPPAPPAATPNIGTAVANEPVRRGLSVLSAFSRSDVWLSAGELAIRAGVPETSLKRFLKTLVHLGYLRRSTAGLGYRLTPSVLALGYAGIAEADIAGALRSSQQQLADKLGCFVALGGRDGLSLTVLSTCDSSLSTATLSLGAGRRTELGTTPMGWALLGGLPPGERRYLLGHLRARHRHQWQELLPRIAETTEQVESQGFCISVNEWGPGVSAVAAPLRFAGRPPLVVACAGPTRAISRGALRHELGPSLTAWIAAIESQTAPI